MRLEQLLAKQVFVQLFWFRNSRVAEKEITIDGLRIPAGTQVEIPTYGLAHDEEYWDEPMKYKPER